MEKVQRFEKGTIVVFTNLGMAVFGVRAKTGATAKVMGYKEKDGKTWIDIEWIRSNKKCREQHDGFYYPEEFTEKK